ncbi:hypothetical protein FBU30_006050 [Linnemannia zychae]|nr:hypothetical protein FBU30_006050 [Linnemannia zychae]
MQVTSSVGSQDSLLHQPADSADPSSPSPSSSMSHLSPPGSSNPLSQQQLSHISLPALSSPISLGPESDMLSLRSSLLATAASTPFQSPFTSGNGSDIGSGSGQEFSPSSVTIQQQSLSPNWLQSSAHRGEGSTLTPNPKGADPCTGASTLAVTAIVTDSAASTSTTQASSDMPSSPFASINSLSSALLGTDLSPHAATINTTAATITGEGAVTVSSTPTTTTTTTFSSSSSSFRPRSRATDLLLNLEASSNDARFQEILHNAIALDLFRQFCFQEYSIENLLFWMDVELFAKPNLEMQRADRLKHKILHRRLEKQQRSIRQGGNSSLENNEDCSTDEKRQQAGLESNENSIQDEKDRLIDGEELEKLRLEVEEEEAQFAVQHARYIYLTYIDTNAPLQVNLSDESRTDIPWPILDANDTQSNNHSHSRNDSGNSSRGGKKSRAASTSDEVIGWPLDRHMFDGAQEHTYQLMKGHTLVRFEDSELWKSAQRMMHEQREEYEKATVHGPLHLQYCPDSSVILSTVARSRSRHPSANPQTLYNWNNSTTDLDRSRDKEEALAKTMSQYFGPIPPSIRHPGRVILGLGPRNGDDYIFDDDFDDFDTFDEHIHTLSGGSQLAAMTDNKRLSSGSSTTGGGLGSGFRKNRFTKRLSVGRNNKGSLSDELASGGDLYDESDYYDLSHDGVDSVANGRRTTRWMVAGYFNDQVRLTAAQRKRLLRRNNKLTKFFGSRVDGTLRPVEETEDGGFIVPPSSRTSVGSLAAMGQNGVPMLGSPLAYALSSSMIHDIDKKGRPKKPRSNKRDSGNGHEVLSLFQGATSSKPAATGSGSRSMSILQKFKRHSGEYYDSNNAQSSRLTNHDDIAASSGHSRHFRSLTSVDLRPPAKGRRVLAAHPHPLWSGSFSDHEADSPTTYERRRQLSILSIIGQYNLSSPQSPHPLISTNAGLEHDDSSNKLNTGGTLDRHIMYTRRKKADKLSTFFGAQLTAQELSSQLQMRDDFAVVAAPSQQQSPQLERKKSLQTLRRPSNDSDRHKAKSVLSAPGPSALSVNQLSHRERTLLWKRNKKLRGILGESLQESEVALSLTNPVLMGTSARLRNSMSSARRQSSGSPLLRRSRSTGSSLNNSKQISCETMRTEDDEDEGEDDAEGEDDSEGYEDLNSSSNLVQHKGTKINGNKSRVRRASTALTAPAGTRARRTSVASNTSSYRRYSRGGRGSVPTLHRAISIQSLDSVQTVDSVLDEDLDDDIRETEEELGIARHYHRRRTSSIRPYGYSHLSPRYRQIHASFASNNNSGLSADVATEALTRINRKKKMDKIQQFLGDRVPEQDLWIGTVGREKTQEMMEKKLLSPSGTTFPQESNLSVIGPAGGMNRSRGTGLNRSATGSSRLTPRFKKTAFSGRTKATLDNSSNNEDILSEKEKKPSSGNNDRSTTRSSRQRPVVITHGGSPGVRMERSLSDPPRLEDGNGNGFGIKSPGAHQAPYQWHTTVSRLRQQLASPVLTSTIGDPSASVPAAGGNVAMTADTITSPTAISPTSLSSSLASPRMSLSSNASSHVERHSTTNFSTAAIETSFSSLPQGLTILHDEEGDDSALSNDESAQILPRLRAMNGKDQERFLKRAEKLEKLFGHFPPSALLQHSLTTTSASLPGDMNVAIDGDSSSGNEDVIVGARHGGGAETSIVQLATFLASTNTQDINASSSLPSPLSPTLSISGETAAVTGTTKKEWASELLEGIMRTNIESNGCSEDGVIESLHIASTATA